MRAMLLPLAVLMVLSRGAAAQGVPDSIAFTARLDDGGAPLDGSHDFEFAIYAAESGGTAVWTETATQAITDGLLYRELGADTPLDSSVLDGRRLFLAITVDGTLLSPRLPILSVPYAVRAETADTLGTLQPGDLFPMGSSLTCTPGDVVTGLEAATGNVICAAPSSVGDVTWATLSSYPACAVAGQALTGLGDTLTCSAFDATADTIADDGVISDSEASDTLTVDATSSVAWTALASYPACAVAGQTITGLGDTVSCSAFDSTADTIADDGWITDAEADDNLSINNGLIFANAVPLVAAADATGAAVALYPQKGGPDGPDGDTIGGAGGSLFVQGGLGGTGAAGGGVYPSSGNGGDGVGATPGGAGGNVWIFLGDGGDAPASTGGAGGAVNISAGSGGDSAVVGAAGGDIDEFGGFGGVPNGKGGDVRLFGGTGDGTGAGGEVTMQPGVSASGMPGTVQIGGMTSAANTTARGHIVMQVVGGDMNVTSPGDGIILKSPDGTVCRVLSVNNSGVITNTAVTCP